MERDGQIRLDRSGNLYQLTHPLNFIAGRVQGHRDGYGFLIPRRRQRRPVPARQRNAEGAARRPRAGAHRRHRPPRPRRKGTIVEVLERANTHVIGRLLNENGVWIVAPEDKRIGQDILVSGSPGKAKAGQVVSVELIEQPSRYSQPVGRIVEVLGEIDDPGMEIEIAVRKYGVPHEFSAAAAQAGRQAARRSARRRPAPTASTCATCRWSRSTAKTRATSTTPSIASRSRSAAAKGFRLIVAIADVSHYVKPNDALDADALERSTSVYFPRRVIPMLPEKLSNGLCSLNPAVDRLALVCDMVDHRQGRDQGVPVLSRP